MKKVFASLLVALLSACGGGGGGSETPSGTAPAPTPAPTTPVAANDPCLTLSPSPLNLTLEEGVSTAVTVQATANCNFPDTINVAIVDDKGVFSSNVNISAQSQYSYAAQLRTAPGLAAGSYDGTLEVKLCKDDPKVCSQPHKGSPWRLPYHLQVNLPISWSVQNPPVIVAGSDSSAAGLTAQSAVNLSGTKSVQWRAAVANAPWLKLVNASGMTNASTLQVAVDPAEFAKLPNSADYTAVVAIAADAPNVPQTTVAVTLRKALADVSYVGPHTLMPGQSATVRLRGHGFSALADLSRLDVSGLTVSNVRRVSDTEIAMTASAANPGSARFSIGNAMGLDTGSASLKIVTPAKFRYQALDSEGVKGTLRFDAERQALLVVNRDLQQVLRYGYDGTGWSASSVSLSGADDAALGPDGAALVVTTLSGRLSLRDPVTLAEQASYQGASYAKGLYVSPRLAVTNDGRAWFPQGNQWNTMAYFDLRTREFGHAGTMYYGGPWFSLSGDGERLVFTQTSSSSPFLPVQYMDAADGVIRDNPDANLAFFYNASQNLDGSRIVLDDQEVRDNTFKVLGKLALTDGPYAGYSYGSVITPDGARTYVMYFGPNMGPTAQPRIVVFDTSKAVSGTFPILGYFDVADSPTSCTPGAYCDPRMSTAISPDGKTLFFAGNKSILVIPVPAVLQQ
nr:hypothetical protein [uncultured Massilia sp.]